MLTQEQALAELRQLNQELGLAEVDGIPMTQAQAEAELRKLDEELASTPESFDEYVTRRKQEDSRSIGEKTSAFTDSFITGAGTLAEEGGRAIKQLFAGDVGLKEAKGVFQVGVKDFGRFAKTLGGAAMDNFYSDEDEMRREYDRYKDNFLYNQNVRTAMLNTFDEKGRDFVSFGANFVDPTMLVPVAGQAAKLGSIGLKSARLGKLANAIEKGGAIASKPTELVAKGTRKAIEKTAQVGSKIAGATGKAGEVTAKAAAFPRNFVTSLAGKAIDPKVAGSGILGAQVTGAFTGAVPGLGLLTSAEVAGYIANKSGRGMERVLTALGSEAGQKRFLQRLAMQADSPTTRKLALYAHKLGGTRMGDMAFNSLVNGISVSTLNGALAYASTDNIEELGQAMGAGFAMGGALPFGQPGMRAGKSQAARNQSSVNFLEAKLGQDQLKQFRKMDPDARLAFATVEEAGIKAPKLMFVDKDLMLQTLREDDPNIRQAPNAYFNQTDNTIYVNENGRASKSSKEAFDILTHELGHGFITQAIKDDPLFARKILGQYEAKPGEKAFEFAFTTDSAGAPIDSIMLNEDAKKIASAYDNIQEGDKSIGVGQNANLLAQEIGAEQFAMMMVDNPNYFNTIEPSLRQKLLEGSRKVLTLFGAVDGNTGNPLDVSISPLLKRNKTIRNLYKNYTKQRDASIADKVDLAKKGVSMKVRKGESADQAVDRMYGKVFGAKSFSLDDVSGFRINNKKIKKILTDIKDRLVESPEGSLRVERNQIVGKELNKDLKEALLFGDKLGNKNVLLNAMLEGIKNLTEFNFLYRAGKPSKYSDNELRARIVTPFQIRVTGLSPRSKSAASVKMDAYDLAYLRNNVEVLAREGFTDKPEDLIKEARRVAQQALEDPDGRINPEGNYENELVTAVFGQPESAQFIKNPKLRQLLEDKKLKHSIRSYDVDALAGLVPTGNSGIAFDWFNIKNNYSPFDDKLFIPAYHGTPHTFAPEPGAPLGKFRTSAIGTGEGAQAYGHGLYFAGKKEVAEHYRKVLSDGNISDFVKAYKDKLSKAGKTIEDGVAELEQNGMSVEARALKASPKELEQLNKGSLYKVELAPKENEYLLWDKPLSEQPKGVREKLKPLIEKPKDAEGFFEDFSNDNYKGEDFYKYISFQFEPRDLGFKNPDMIRANAAASAALKEAGIPGIKYLDGSSRSKGEGDYNYVIFDEADVQITDKLFMPAEDVMTAVNVRNELNNKFADLIVSGQKSIETRRSRSLDNLIGNRVKIVRTTGKGDEARVIGEVTVGEPIQYRTRAEFAKDYDKHLVDEDSDFAFQDGGKFGYPMINPERYDSPYPMPKRKGIVYTKEVGGPDKLFMPASEAGAGKGKQAEAAKLWQEKGTESPYFKKWFGKSKVVDENGEPLVVYHGTPGKLEGNFFDPNKLGEGHDVEGAGFYFTNDRAEASGYKKGENGTVYETYLSLKNPIDESTPIPSVETVETLIAKANDAKSIEDLYQKFEDNEDLFWESSLSNWSEDPYSAVASQVQAVRNYETAHEAFQTVWYDVFLGENKPYMKAMTEIGIDGVILKSETRHQGNDHYIAFDSNSIKSATGNRGTFDAGERNILFMPSDSNYLKAVKEGDMQTAQQMVDQKARENGYDILAFHGTPEGGFDVFETKKQSVKGSNTVDPNTFLGSHFAEDPKVAQKFVDDLYGAKEGKNPQLYKVYLKLEKPLGGDRGKGFNETKAQTEANKKARKKIADQLKQAHDQVDKINIKTDPSEFLKIMEQKGISEATAEIAKQKKKKNPELFKRIERLNEKLQKIPNTSESIKIDLPGGEAFLSGDRALINEGQFGLQALVKDNMGRDPKAESNVKYDMNRRQELGIKMRKALDELGYDSVVYDNAVEGGIGIIVTDPSQIKSAEPVTYDSKGNPIPLSKRFDSSKDSYLYMPTDSKASKRQPANRITRQAPAMPGNRFMLPAASAGAKSAERFR